MRYSVHLAVEFAVVRLVDPDLAVDPDLDLAVDLALGAVLDVDLVLVVVPPHSYYAGCGLSCCWVVHCCGNPVEPVHYRAHC